MKSEPRRLRRKRVWPLLVFLLLLMFWFSRQTATVSPASKATDGGPSERNSRSGGAVVVPDSCPGSDGDVRICRRGGGMGEGGVGRLGGGG